MSYNVSAMKCIMLKYNAQNFVLAAESYKVYRRHVLKRKLQQFTHQGLSIGVGMYYCICEKYT